MRGLVTQAILLPGFRDALPIPVALILPKAFDHSGIDAWPLHHFGQPVNAEPTSPNSVFRGFHKFDISRSAYSNCGFVRESDDHGW